MRLKDSGWTKNLLNKSLRYNQLNKNALKFYSSIVFFILIQSLFQGF